MSIGFTVTDKEYKNSRRHIKEMILWECSLVTFACNEKAKITDFKKLELNSNDNKKQETHDIAQEEKKIYYENSSFYQENKKNNVNKIETIKDINNYLKQKGLSKNETESILAKMRNIIKGAKPIDNQGNPGSNNILEALKINIESLNLITKKIKE